MNIFFLHQNPHQAAKYQYNKHIVKMVLESAQMLCTAHHCILGDEADVPYKAAHKNHPSTVWARRSANNYEWLYHHFVALSAEYKRRYGKEHLSFTKLAEFLKNPPKNLTKGPMTPFAQAMPDDVKDSDPVVAYKNYYTKYKREIATWNRGRQQPTWWK